MKKQKPKIDKTTKSAKSLITIPEELNTRIKAYQIRKNISLKKVAIIQMLKDFCETEEGKKLTTF
jgi:hypothetical protein